MTSDCRVLKHKDGNGRSNDKFKNKSWKRKSEDASDVKKDLHAFIQKTIKAGFANEAKKRKVDSDNEFDLNAMDLEGFNYKDMDDLKIDDDKSLGEISV